MYIIELIAKKLTQMTQKKEKNNYNPMQEAALDDYEGCEHVFMPIDSTNETLSCTKCGIIVKRSAIIKELKDRNFFLNNDSNNNLSD